MNFDIQVFLKAAVTNTAVLLPLIMAITTLAGKFGVSGKAQLVTSLVTGFILGVATQIASVGMPVSFAEWLALILFGLVPGLTASGVYEAGKAAIAKANE